MSRAVLDGRRTTSWWSAQVGEEQLHLAVSRLRRVAAVDEVLADLEAKSPRIEPGADLTGSVTPISPRTASWARGPSATSATSGPLVMKSTSSPKNGLPLCSA